MMQQKAGNVKGGMPAQEIPNVFNICNNTAPWKGVFI
jgi:hypothetical protein